ncbi:methyltransferase domain containing protein [Hyaloscypha variabilis]
MNKSERSSPPRIRGTGSPDHTCEGSPPIDSSTGNASPALTGDPGNPLEVSASSTYLDDEAASDLVERDADGDSAFGDDSAPSEFASLLSEARDYVFENGRRYHGYKEGRYMLPNDESEMDREDMKHHISMLITEGRLHLAPIDKHPQRAVDIGTGTGIWAIEFADSYPSAQVIATDLSPIQPTWVPPNLNFEIDDAEDEWLYKPDSLDFVHCRYLFHGIRNWPKLFGQAMRTLKPGGWIEIVEMHVIPISYDNSLPANSQIQAFYDVLAEIGQKVGIDLAVAQKFRGMLEKAGYEEVNETVFDLPIGGWMPERRMREVGLFQQFQMTEGLHGIAFGLLTRVGGWDPIKVEAFLAGVRSEMKDPNVRCLYKLYFVYGRKPR